MGSFKEAGKFVPVDVPSAYRDGGVNLREGYSVKPEQFRLRPLDQQKTTVHVSKGDITPIELFPGDLLDITLPELESIRMGMEIEFSFIDSEGNPVSLYGRDVAERLNGHISINSTGDDWLLDVLGVAAEGLRFQGELGVKPATSWDELKKNVMDEVFPVYQKCRERGILMLPTGLLGSSVAHSWSTISPHPYVARIMEYGLEGSALSFDAQTVQAHVDLRAFGSIAEFGIYVGNTYNNLLATMFNAVGTSAPFWKGEITPYQSNREFARNALSTKGGVQGDIPVNAHRHLELGDRLMRQGRIPAPERAGSVFDEPGNGSHKDARPAKYSIGTTEFGSADMGPNVDFWIAQSIILRQFVWKIAEHLKTGEPLPSFLVGVDFEKRKHNRLQAALYGNNAALITQQGIMTTGEAWERFFEWVQPVEQSDDWERAQDAIERMLARCVSVEEQKRIEAFFDPGSPAYMRGTFSDVMKGYVQRVPGNTEARIRATNVAVGRAFMEHVQQRIKHPSL